MEEPEINELIEELRTFCQTQHGNQRQVAATLGISEALLSNLLAGRTGPTLRLFFKIRRLLGPRWG
jgi:transcriptional regulator with XRE-family HTH domain